MSIKKIMYHVAFQFIAAIAMVMTIPSFNEFYYAGNFIGLVLSILSLAIGIGAFYISNRL